MSLSSRGLDWTQSRSRRKGDLVVDGPLDGVRVVEVAQFVFVPAAGAVLCDWGAEVIKVEHAERGDPQRGFANAAQTTINAGLEHANRGKLSIGLALDQPAAREILLRLVETADVFLTNYLPHVRRKLGIDVDDIRAVNPDIIYACGSNVGRHGAEASKGGFDLGTFWARAAGAAGVSPEELGKALTMPGPAYGDTICGTTLAGGIVAALFRRLKTGQPSIVDVSLLGVGAWVSGMSVAQSLATGIPWRPPALDQIASRNNPLMGAYRTADGRFIQLVMNRPGLYWRDFCEHIGLADLPDDPRFSTVESLMQNSADAAEIIAAEFAKRTRQEWVECFESLAGQWSVVQDSLELGHDPQLRANGHIARVRGADDVEYELVTSPVLFDDNVIDLERAPTFAEHTDELVRSLGIDDDELIDLKVRGAIA
jgi:crotonobetainyl-CoA:carnitine CoA-transferase CaiB-like acyl-CoA transferase